MALEYFLYRTDFNNTLIDRSDSSFTLGTNEGQIQIDAPIPKGQTLFVYRESGGTIIENSDSTINAFLDVFDLPQGNSEVTYNVFTGYTATTDNTLGRFSIGNTPTGLITGGTLSINPVDNTKYDIAAGKGVIVDAYTNPDNPTAKFIEWNDITGITLSGVTSRVASFITIGYDENFNVITNELDIKVRESSVTLSSTRRRNEILLGSLTHIQKTVIEKAKSRPITSTDIGNQVYDLFYNKFRISKLDNTTDVVIPNGDNLLIDLKERNFFVPNYNSDLNIDTPNILSFSGETGVTLLYSDARGGNIETRNTIDPTKYNPNGSDIVVDITGNTNQATIQRVYQYPDGTINVQYGQNLYETIIEATENVLTEDITQFADVSDASILIGVIAVTVNATELNNRRDSIFFRVSNEGEILGGQNGQFFNEKRKIVVRNLSDFPEPTVNNEIQLRDNYQYKINGFVDIGNNRLVTGNNTLIYSDYAAGNGLFSNRPDAFIYGRNNNITISELTLRNFDTSGSVFDFAASGTSNFIVDRLLFTNTRVGNVYNYFVMLIEKNAMFNCYDGYIVSGDTTEKIGKFKMNDLLMSSPQDDFTALTVLDSVFSKVNVTSSYFLLDGGTGTTALNIPANLELESGLLIGNEFIGTGTTTTFLTGGLTKGELKWTFDGNTNLADSIKLGFLKTTDNTLETTVNNITDYFLGNFNVDDSFGERFIINGNRITANTNREIDGSIILTGDLTANSNNQTINIAIFKNGVTLITKTQVRVVTSGINYPFSLNDIVTLVNGDYLEIAVRNLTQTRNVIISNVQFRVNSTA